MYLLSFWKYHDIVQICLRQGSLDCWYDDFHCATEWFRPILQTKQQKPGLQQSMMCLKRGLPFISFDNLHGPEATVCMQRRKYGRLWQRLYFLVHLVNGVRITHCNCVPIPVVQAKRNCTFHFECKDNWRWILDWSRFDDLQLRYLGDFTLLQLAGCVSTFRRLQGNEPGPDVWKVGSVLWQLQCVSGADSTALRIWKNC